MFGFGVRGWTTVIGSLLVAYVGRVVVWLRMVGEVGGDNGFSVI